MGVKWVSITWIHLIQRDPGTIGGMATLGRHVRSRCDLDNALCYWLFLLRFTLPATTFLGSLPVSKAFVLGSAFERTQLEASLESHPSE